ncbi:MAG: phage holin family protein [Chloroflexota bacterium]
MAREVGHIKEERAATGHDNRSLGDLFSELTRETTTLVRQEIDLAKTEMTHKATRVGKDIGFLVAGGAVAYAGLLTLIAFVVLWLGSVIPMWTSALIVAIAVLAVGGVLVKQGISNLKKEELAPRQTLETLKDDKQWATEQTR